MDSFKDFFEISKILWLAIGGGLVWAGDFLYKLWTIKYKVKKESNNLVKDEIDINKSQLEFFSKLITQYDERLQKLLSDYDELEKRSEKQKFKFIKGLQEKDKIIQELKESLLRDRTISKQINQRLEKRNQLLKNYNIEIPDD